MHEPGSEEGEEKRDPAKPLNPMTAAFFRLVQLILINKRTGVMRQCIEAVELTPSRAGVLSPQDTLRTLLNQKNPEIQRFKVEKPIKHDLIND
jgi:hypothetical protein